ncbi:MAG: glycosyltransferase [Thiohalocapsa sp.]|nr:glycosyltransferase [Thiohalocapsa sp.]
MTKPPSAAVAPAHPASPRVSIVLPFRDAADTLPGCIGSIQAQTLTDFELLCIDDGSTDGGSAAVARLAASDARIRLLASPGKGLVDALNFGLDAARAPLVARMDADDLMHPRRLAPQAAAMQASPDISVLATRVRAFPEQALTDGFRAYIDWQNACVAPQAIADDLYLESPLAHPSVMLRGERIRNLGGYRRGPFPEDYELWLRLMRRGHVIAKLPQPLLLWRDHPRRLSRNHACYTREAFDRLRAGYLARDERVRAARGRLVIWGAGRRTRQRVRHLLDWGYRPAAWIDIDPRKVGNRLDGVPVVGPQWLHRRSPKPLVLSYVASHGARPCIEAELARFEYRKGMDYLHIG